MFVLREFEGYNEFGGYNSKNICKEVEIPPSNLHVLLHHVRLRLAIDVKITEQEGGKLDTRYAIRSAENSHNPP